MFYLLKKRTEPVYTFDFFTNGNTKMRPCVKLEIHVPKHHFQYGLLFLFGCHSKIIPIVVPLTDRHPTENRGYKTHIDKRLHHSKSSFLRRSEGLGWGPLVNMQQKPGCDYYWEQGDNPTQKAVFVSVCWDWWCLEPAKMLPNSFPQQTLAWYFLGFILNGRCLEFRRMVISFQYLSIIFFVGQTWSNHSATWKTLKRPKKIRIEKPFSYNPKGLNYRDQWWSSKSGVYSSNKPPIYSFWGFGLLSTLLLLVGWQPQQKCAARNPVCVAP